MLILFSFLIKTVGVICSNKGFSFPSKSNILIFNIHIKTDGHQCSRQVSLTGDIFATRVGKKQEEESAEIRELLCQPTNANGMTNTKRSHKKIERKALIKKYLYLI